MVQIPPDFPASFQLYVTYIGQKSRCSCITAVLMLCQEEKTTMLLLASGGASDGDAMNPTEFVAGI